MDYAYIKTNHELMSYLRSYEDKKNHVIALDLEAELNLHAYGERLCLIQILDDTRKILIDPFGIKNHALKKLFESKNVLKVMYDASSDLSLMKNSYGIDIESILDLRPAVDLLAYPEKNLHSVIAAELGVVLEHKSRYQKHNWTRRPIDRRAIEYALNDITYLLELKDAILQKLCSQQMLEVFLLKNLQIQRKDYTRNTRDKYRKIRGYHGLAENQKAVFRKIYEVREKYAKRLNMPTHNIIGNTNMITLAQDAESLGELKFPKRFSVGLIEEILQELKAALKQRS